jgi:protein tyrosine phosphatase
MMSTRNDFWQMIWNNRTTVIVSLYADENLSSDIFNYWPLLNQIIDCENIHVCLIDEHFECEYIYRDCLIRSTKVRKKQIFFLEFFFGNFQGK